MKLTESALRKMIKQELVKEMHSDTGSSAYEPYNTSRPSQDENDPSSETYQKLEDLRRSLSKLKGEELDKAMDEIVKIVDSLRMARGKR